MDRRPGDPGVEAGLRAWLAKDDRNEETYEQARLIWSLSPRLEPSLLDDPQEPRAGILSPPPRPLPRPGRDFPRRRGRRTAVWGGAALAACILLFMALGGWTELIADFTTRTGEMRVVSAADGSRIELNTNTAIRFVGREDQRTVELLRGEAFFAVNRETRVFAVIAGAARIEVLGTRFDVRRDADAVSVTVEEGRVAVTYDGEARTEPVILSAGDGVTLDLGSGAYERRREDPQLVATWREGRLVVDRWSVAQVLDEIGRYYPGYIVLRDPATLGAEMVSGSYDLTRPEDAVRAVAHTYGGNVTAIGSRLLIVSPR